MSLKKEKIRKWIFKKKIQKILYSIWSDENHREIILQTLEEDGISIIEFIYNALINEDRVVRLNAISVINNCDIQDEKFVIPLINTLKDKKSYVKTEAIDALEKLKDIRTITPLIECFDDKDIDIGKKAAGLLSKFESKYTYDQLVDKIKNQNPFTRMHVILACKDYNDKKTINLLIKALLDDDYGVRMYAAEALQFKNDKEAISSLINSFKNRDLAVVSGAYDFFISRGEEGTESLLIDALLRGGYYPMCLAYLNSGNKKLEEAGRTWAANSGYSVESSKEYLSIGKKWGSKK